MNFRACVILAGLCCAQLTSACAGSVPKPQEESADHERAARQRQAQELFDRGMAFSKGGDSVRAEHYINASIQAGFPEEQAFPELISVCVNAGRLRSALNYAEPRLRLRPSDVGLRYLVGSLHLGLRQTTQALVELETLLTIAPKEGRAHYLLGVTLAEELDDEAAARPHFAEYLKLDPTGRYAPEVRLWLRQHPLIEAPAAVLNTPPTDTTLEQDHAAPTADASPLGLQP